MLVLSRRTAQKIVLPSIQATIEILRVKGNTVRLGIQAPHGVPVLREEIADSPPRQRQLEPQMDRSPESADRKAGEPPGKGSGISTHFVRNQLHTTSIGLALLRRQIEAGMFEASESTLDRLEGELKKTLERWQRSDSQPEPPPARGSRPALLVEDNQNERELLAGFLRMSGFDVVTAGDGADALDYLSAKGRPDFMLLDMIMPRCDGPATVRSIRANPELAGLKIFAVSGISPDEVRLESGPAGVDRWFSKPVDPNTLVQVLNRELGT